MNHEIVLSLRRVPAVPGALGFRATIASRAPVRLALPFPSHRGLWFESIATDEAREGGWWVEEVTGFRPLVLEPGESLARSWRVWPCDRAERLPWRWFAEGAGWCVDLPRACYPLPGGVRLQGRPRLLRPGFPRPIRATGLARAAEAVAWLGSATSNRIQFGR